MIITGYCFSQKNSIFDAAGGLGLDNLKAG